MDKRSWEIYLTEQGSDLAQKVIAIGKEVDQIVLSGLGKTQKETLMSLLAQVNTNAASKEGQSRTKKKPAPRTGQVKENL